MFLYSKNNYNEPRDLYFTMKNKGNLEDLSFNRNSMEVEHPMLKNPAEQEPHSLTQFQQLSIPDASVMLLIFLLPPVVFL